MKKFKEKIYNGLPSQKESCKKSFSCALRAKSIKLGKKCISVYLITKINGNHFLASSMKQIILKRKMKNHFREISLVLRFDALFIQRACYIFKKATIIKSSQPEVFCEKDVLRNFAKFTGIHLCQSIFFNKVAGLRLRPATILKRDSGTGVSV